MKEDKYEKDLLRRCSKGDREAFSILYLQYLQPLYQHTYLFLRCKESSEEIVQNVFVRLWEDKSRFEKIRSFRPFIYQMTKNMVIDHIRRTQAEEKAINHIIRFAETGGLTSEDLLIYKDYLDIAQEAIDQLTEKRRTIFLMRTQQALSIDEIAADLHISRSVVKKQLYESVSRVREHIEKYARLPSGALLMVILFY